MDARDEVKSLSYAQGLTRCLQAMSELIPEGTLYLSMDGTDAVWCWDRDDNNDFSVFKSTPKQVTDRHPILVMRQKISEYHAKL